MAPPTADVCFSLTDDGRPVFALYLGSGWLRTTILSQKDRDEVAAAGREFGTTLSHYAHDGCAFQNGIYGYREDRHPAPPIELVYAAVFEKSFTETLRPNEAGEI